MKRMLVVCAVAVVVGHYSTVLVAQETNSAAGAPGGRSGANFDPAQFQQRMMDNIKQRMGLTNETWDAVQPLIQKVMDARREASSFGRFGGRRSESTSTSGDAAGQRRAGGGSNPDAEALQKAIDSSVPAAQVKAALEKYRESRKGKKAALEQAQEDLRKVLSVKQEAQAVLLGLLE